MPPYFLINNNEKIINNINIKIDNIKEDENIKEINKENNNKENKKDYREEFNEKIYIKNSVLYKQKKIIGKEQKKLMRSSEEKGLISAL